MGDDLRSSGVFLSYATEDTNLVKPYVEALESQGVDVWIDFRKIEYGDDLVREIYSAMDEAKIGLVFLSKKYVSKPWTREELSFLRVSTMYSEGKRRLVVVKMDDVDPPPELKQIAWVFQPAAEELALRVKNILGNSKIPLEQVHSFEGEGDGESCEIDDLDGDLISFFAKEIYSTAMAGRKQNSYTDVNDKLNGDTYRIFLGWERIEMEWIGDVEHQLKLAKIHSSYVRNLNTQIQKGGLGILETAFSIELEERLEMLDSTTEVLRKLIKIAVLKILKILRK